MIEGQLGDGDDPRDQNSGVSSFLEMVKHAYGDEFVGLVLFGSQARGDAHQDSDIDAGVVLKRVDDRRVVRDRLAELAYDVLLETGEDIQAIAISQEEREAPGSFSNPSSIQSMKQDGFALVGP